MNYNGYINSNSIIHRMNPFIKFLLSIIFIILIFIPYGFIMQIILFVIIISLYFVAKLPFKRLLKIFLSIFVMMLILLLVNWITYKGPGVVFDFQRKVHKLYNLNFESWYGGNNLTVINDREFLQGFMWGGKSFNGVMHINENNTSYTFVNGFYLSDSKIDKSLIDLMNKWAKTNGYKLIQSPYLDAIYLYSNNWYSISSFAILLMMSVSIKILLMILIVTILTATTSAVELTYALEDMLSPLRIFKLPVTVWSTTIALGIRFIPSLLDESDRIMKAQASRGLDYKNGNIKDKLLSLTSFIVPLFSIAFKKADELANAMEARGYNPRYIRTRYREYKIYVLDWISYFILIFILGFIIAMQFVLGKHIFISPLGPLEAIQMFGI